MIKGTLSDAPIRNPAIWGVQLLAGLLRRLRLLRVGVLKTFIVGLPLLRHPGGFSVRFLRCPANIVTKKPPDIAPSGLGPFEDPVSRLVEDAGNAAGGE
jgi:hypothetical protein